MSFITLFICSYCSTFDPPTRDTSSELVTKEILHELNELDIAKWKQGHPIEFNTIIEGVHFRTTLDVKIINSPCLCVDAVPKGNYGIKFPNIEVTLFDESHTVHYASFYPKIQFTLVVPKAKIPEIENGTQEREAKVSATFQSLDFTDAVVKVEDSEFRVHKFILATHSEYFKSVFTTTHEFQENRSGIVTLREYSASSMRNALSYMYTGKVDRDFEPMEGFKLADYLGCSSYKQFCKSQMMLNLNKENALDALRMIEIDSEKDVKPYVLEFLKQNKEVLRNTEKLKLFSPELLIELIQFL